MTVSMRAGTGHMETVIGDSGARVRSRRARVATVCSIHMPWTRSLELGDEARPDAISDRSCPLQISVVMERVPLP